jgi:hypothetical protein
MCLDKVKDSRNFNFILLRGEAYIPFCSLLYRAFGLWKNVPEARPLLRLDKDKWGGGTDPHILNLGTKRK